MRDPVAVADGRIRLNGAVERAVGSVVSIAVGDAVSEVVRAIYDTD